MEKVGKIVETERFAKGIWAFVGTYGLCYLGKVAGIPHTSFTVMSILIFVVLFGVMTWTEKRLAELSDIKRRRQRVRYAAVLSFLFAISMIVGYQLQTYGMTSGGVKAILLILLRAVCLGIAFFPLGNLFFEGIEKIGGAKIAVSDGKRWRSGIVFGVSALVIFLCLIPVWLAYYPIIMSYDFHRQVNEAANGFLYFWPYQPIAHTWLIWLFLQLGRLMGDLEAGMAGMALLHMLTYALVTAYACTMLYRITKRKWVVPVGSIFFGIFPLNTVLVVCTTKDVLFSVLFLLFVLLMVERFFFCQGKRKLLMDVLLALEGCVMTQFRNNALYAVLVFGVFWVLLAARKEKVRVLILCVFLVVGSKGISAVVKSALGTQLKAPKVEMCSVPIMQFARVGYYHANELDEETWLLLNQYVPAESWEGYYPPISDSTKAAVAGTTFSNAWEGHFAQLLKDWFKLGIQFPNEYIDAFLELTRGYWFWDDRSNVECLGYGTEGRMGTIYTYNSSAMADGTEIVHESKFPWLEEQLEKIVSANAYYNWPILSILFRAAFYFWGIILLFVSYIYLRRKEQAVICLFPLLYTATLLLGPVVQIRYIFPVMLILPVMISLLILPPERERIQT